MCTGCLERQAVVKGFCHRCYNRENARARNGQVGPFSCPDCGVETRAFKDWSGARCSNCSHKIKLARLKESRTTPEGKEKRREYNRAQRHRWAEEADTYRREYLQRPDVLEREQQRSHNRRAIRKAQTEDQIGYVSPDIRQLLYVAQGGRCAFCTKQLKGVYHLDHVVPLAKGGLHDDANFQILCPFCNISKGARDPVEWAQSKGKLF